MVLNHFRMDPLTVKGAKYSSLVVTMLDVQTECAVFQTAKYLCIQVLKSLNPSETNQNIPL